MWRVPNGFQGQVNGCCAKEALLAMICIAVTNENAVWFIVSIK
tara:strand:- start:191 stop:319 length:129 start_codon:yes stop_codon:yes gene_type:complete